jgi:hypothetical protein
VAKPGRFGANPGRFLTDGVRRRAERRSAGGVAAVQVDLRACHARGRPSGALGVKPGAGLSETRGIYRDTGAGGVRRSPGERE